MKIGDGVTNVNDLPFVTANNDNLINGSATGSLRTIGSAEEDDTYTMGEYAFAEGQGAKASGNVSHAEGAYTYAKGNSAHAEGRGLAYNMTFKLTGDANAVTYTVVDNGYPDYSTYFIPGRRVRLASSDSADDAVMITAFSTDDSGVMTVTLEKTLSSEALTDASIYLFGTVASSRGAHAEGEQTAATNSGAHAEGSLTVASGSGSHAEGMQSAASGAYSHAEGYYTKASSAYQHVQGKYNIEDAGSVYAHIVGNGRASGAESNAHTIDWDGNGWFAGDVYVGGTGQDDSSATKLAKESQSATITVAASDWTGDEAPYAATVSTSLATADNNLIVGAGGTLTAEEQAAMAAAMIVCTAQADGSVTLSAFGTLPSVDLPVNILVVG